MDVRQSIEELAPDLELANAPPQESKGSKRPAEDDIEHEDAVTAEPAADDATANDAPLSKNQLRKLKRQKLWEEKKADKKVQRKEKRHAKQERKREAKQAEIAAAVSEGKDPVLVVGQNKPAAKQPSTSVPITVILDCQYEKYMLDKELVSMASQATRCYSDNRKARYRTNLVVSSFGGVMRSRFEQVLSNQYKNWKGVKFVEDDFVKAAHDANAYTAGPDGGEMIPTLQKPVDDSPESEAVVVAKPPPPDSKKKAKLAATAPAPELESDDVDKSIVYLTADSPYTLERLEPNTTYVIGGIIDRNREKGLCYKVARERNVRTAKLPIGEFMVLQSRHVLATNHVMEIMLKWLELGDWGKAFMQVIPTRKGGKLRDGEEDDHEGEQVPQAPGGAAATDDEGNLADVEQGTTAEELKKSEDQTAAQQPEAAEEEPAVEVEGDNSDAGLEKNALNQQRWSAPPVDFEEVLDPEQAPSSKDVA